jgi:threonine aldolase
MANAEVGDDVFGDDPTVNKLQEVVAELLGKEAALYVPSGTMANQLALRCLTQTGDEIIIHEDSHHYYYESGGGFVISSVIPRLVRGEKGMFRAEDIENALRSDDVHFPPTTVVWIENTTNRGGGAVWDLKEIERVKKVADKHNLRMHLDGARLWNASVASGIPEKEYAKYFDTVNVCFSKGLGAPVGSAFISNRETIDRARRYRKLLGGGMRQAGIIAAGALYALEHNRERLKDDHANAKKLAYGISELPGFEINPDSVETNIVIFRVTSIPAREFADRLYEKGIWVLAIGNDKIRAVTNLHITSDDIDRVLLAAKNICG